MELNDKEMSSLCNKFEQVGSVWLFDRGEDGPLMEADGERLNDKELKTICASLAAINRVAGEDAEKSLRHAFRNVDDLDWQHLYKFIPYSGHGQFWMAVFDEARAALAAAGDRTGVPHDQLLPHDYFPSAMHQGDCYHCGNIQNHPIHKPVSPGKGEGWRETPALNDRQLRALRIGEQAIEDLDFRDRDDLIVKGLAVRAWPKVTGVDWKTWLTAYGADVRLRLFNPSEGFLPSPPIRAEP